MTEIDAINKMMRYVGEIPVPISVVIDDLPAGHEAKEARTILGEQTRELQSVGYWFNKEEWTFIPDVGGTITIPSDVINIKSTNANQDYLVKGGDLYNVNTRTKVFTSNVTLETVFEVPLEDLPESFLNVLLYTSAKELHLYLNGDENTQKELDKKLGQAVLRLDAEKTKRSNVNLVKGSRLIDRGANPSPLS